jgi:NAD(P)-dependent dehydrogenase (short-subunit alcohol dehydrogenase family)
MRSLKELQDLGGRVALVTGGAGHIGSAVADGLAELGARVVVLDAELPGCEAVSLAIRGRHQADVAALATDLSDEAAVRQVPEQVLDRFGRLDVLVNCAAMVSSRELGGWTTPFAEQLVEPWRQALEVNLTAPFLLAQLLAPALKSSGHGSIINIGSLYGVAGPDMSLYEGTQMGNSAAYAASKGGLLQLTRWLATVLAPDIRVNAVSPGGVWRDQPAAFAQRYSARTPLRRMAREEDFKGAVAYLASDLSAYVTGQNLIVDGGFTVW